MRIRQHVPRVILTKGRKISGHSQGMVSAIGERLLTINCCITSYEDDCFSVLHRVRNKIHLNVLEAIYIAINRTPTSMQTVKQSYSKYFKGCVGDWGNLNIFILTLSLQSNYLIYTPFLIIFPVTKLDRCRTKGP